MFTLVAYIITTQLVLFFFIYTSTTESYTYRPTLSLPDSLPICYSMMTAIKTAERRLAKGTLLHAGGQLMAWTVGNLKIEPTATAIRATKANAGDAKIRSEEHTSELQSLMRISYDVFCLKKKKRNYK